MGSKWSKVINQRNENPCYGKRHYSEGHRFESRASKMPFEISGKVYSYEHIVKDFVHQKSERCALIAICVYVSDVLRWARTQLSWQKVSFATFSKWLKGWEGCGSKIKTGHQIFFSIRATLEDENLNFLKWIKTSFDDIRRFFHFLPLYPGDRLLRIFTRSNRIVLISILTWPLSSKMTNIVIGSFPIVM